MPTYLIRPAPARSEQSFTLTGGHLAGSDWDLDLDALTDIGFTSYAGYGRMIWRLDLEQGDQKHWINANLPKKGGAASADYVAFQKLATALVNDLAHRKPDVQIALGERGLSRHVIFGLGCGAALGGLGIGLAALSNGRGVEAALPAVLLIVFGVGLALSNAPWVKPRRIDPASLPAILTRLAGG